MVFALEELHQLIRERNERETFPFQSVYESNAALLDQVDSLQKKLDIIATSSANNQQPATGDEASVSATTATTITSTTDATTNAALKNEARLREKLEKLEHELEAKQELHSTETSKAQMTADELATSKIVVKEKEAEIKSLLKDQEKMEKTIKILVVESEEAKSNQKLAETQYQGLKESIRTLQEENAGLKEENNKLIERMVDEKQKMLEQVNVLNEMVEGLQTEVERLRSQRAEDQLRRQRFGKSAVSTAESLDIGTAVRGPAISDNGSTTSSGASQAIVPEKALSVTDAHPRAEATCVRFDAAGSNLVATCGSDSTVKLWTGDAGTRTLKATLKGANGHTMIACDIHGTYVVSGGSDKTCRVWNVQNARMVHQLVGHTNTITCLRLFDGDKRVLSGSADGTLKVWDISHRTYRQTATMKHSSIANCVDVTSDVAVSGHVDGALRFWDVRTGDRTAEIPSVHGNHGIVSVQFHPRDAMKVLTSGKDSFLKLVDIRTCRALQVFRDADFQTTYGCPSSALSPDGECVVAGSAVGGNILIWQTTNGRLVRKLSGAHNSVVTGVVWGNAYGPAGNQEVASIDRAGKLILWGT